MTAERTTMAVVKVGTAIALLAGIRAIQYYMHNPQG